MWINQPRCINCNKEIEEPLLRCPYCESLVTIPPIEGPPLSKINLASMWSLQSFIPIFKNPISLAEGNTPLLHLTKDSDLKYLGLKLEFRNPTGTFRDRACSLILSDAYQRKYDKIVGASTGSFSISLSAYAAKAGIESINVVPHNLELSKIEQMKLYGSKVIEKGEFVNDAITAAEKTADKEQAYSATPEKNLLTIEGQKTISLEILLQKENIESIIVPRGSGSLVYSIYRGLEDALASGWIKNIPKLYTVSLEKTKTSYLAESLDSKQPFLLREVEDLLKKTDGKEIGIKASVMIEEALKIAKSEGLFIEPASASVIAAARRLINNKELEPSRSVAILTGSGFNALNIFASQVRGKKKIVWGLSESSTTKFEILNLIAEEKADYGYAIWESLGRDSIRIQAIYQHLSELESKGLINVKEKKGKRNHYILTRKGVETLQKMRDLIDYI
ncbi:MAG: pyridoxal-phosphate dependent enzyme [Candidatus Thorarchaeota archaeon]